VYKRQQ